jgi:Zn-dependent M28 family amino/carboxypeptidase
MKISNVLWGVLCSLLLVLSCTSPQPESMMDVFNRINEEALQHSEAYMRLGEASEQIGHRLTGSENGAASEEYVYQLLSSWGFDDVQYQPFEVQTWSRGSIAVQVGNSGSLLPVSAVSLAHSPVEADLEAEIIDLGNGLEEDYAKVGDKVSGKIALVYIGLLPGTAEGTQNLHRSEKTALATANGAVGIIIHNQVDGGVLLTGTASVTGSLIDIPAVCISKEDGASLRERLQNESIHAHIQMTNKADYIKARNVIATLPGAELPEEKIVVGGHLDSWDLATGAMDNGIGSFAVLDMARTFKALNLQPRRTIEFVMFMGEEQGLLGSRHYVKQAKEAGDLDQIKYMFNHDMTGNPIGYNAGGRPETEALINELGAMIMEVDSSTFKNQNRSGAGLHSDHQPFMLEGIPILSPVGSLEPSVFDCYHADCDDFTLVNEAHIRDNARFSSMLLYALADRQDLPSYRMEEEEIRDFLIRNGLRLKLQIGGDWRWEN